MKTLIIKLLAFKYKWLSRAFNGLEIKKIRNELGSIGSNVTISYGANFTARNIYIGHNVHIGSNALFWCSESKIIIKDNVVFGPNVTIMAGDHNITEIGRFMINVKNKLPENDVNVNINEDVWIGCNVTILKGVVIGRGSVIAAGSLVVKNVPPYAIVGGVVARVLKYRWDIETILKHEEIAYPAELRLTPLQLTQNYI